VIGDGEAGRRGARWHRVTFTLDFGLDISAKEPFLAYKKPYGSKKSQIRFIQLST